MVKGQVDTDRTERRRLGPLSGASSRERGRQARVAAMTEPNPLSPRGCLFNLFTPSSDNKARQISLIDPE